MSNTMAEDLKAALDNNHVSCAVAWQIAKKHNVSKKRVGETADELKARITDCQLGCFKVSKATHEDLVSLVLQEPLSQEIKRSLEDDGTLFCESAFKVAKKVKVTPRAVGDATTKMGLHIRRCQLGCF